MRLGGGVFAFSCLAFLDFGFGCSIVVLSTDCCITAGTSLSSGDSLVVDLLAAVFLLDPVLAMSDEVDRCPFFDLSSAARASS